MKSAFRKNRKNEESEFMTVRQLCDLAGFSLTTFHRRVKSGDLPPRYKIGRQYRFLRSESILWIKGELTLDDLHEESCFESGEE